MHVRPWYWPAAILIPALLAMLIGLFIIDVRGEAVIARQQERVAKSARDYFASFAREEGLPSLLRAVNRREVAGSANGLRYAVVSDDGRMLAGADVISSLDIPSDLRAIIVAEPDVSPPHRWRVLSEPLGEGVSLVVAEDLRARDELRDAILDASIVALVLTALGAAGGGLAINTLVLRRTRQIADAAERIAAGDLSARAPTRSGGDVFDALGASINTMLGRIDELLTGLRAATDAITHELRSPLGRLRNALDAAAAAKDSRSQNEALDHAHFELDQVTATLNALLDIARAESGLSAEMMRPLNITALAEELAELFGPAAEDADQRLLVDLPHGHLQVWAHEALLRQALGNLLHNAITYAGAGAAITLSVRREGEARVRVEVIDTGGGVPAEDLARAKERFVRLESSGSSPGTGLGLALVAACAKLHGSRLDLSGNDPGLRASLELRAVG